jgi:hypothetical protein
MTSMLHHIKSPVAMRFSSWSKLRLCIARRSKCPLARVESGFAFTVVVNDATGCRDCIESNSGGHPGPDSSPTPLNAILWLSPSPRAPIHKRFPSVPSSHQLIARLGLLPFLPQPEHQPHLNQHRFLLITYFCSNISANIQAINGLPN